MERKTTKNYKQTIFGLIILCMVFAMPFASADLVTRGAALDATLLYYQPVPAQPGDEVEVWIQVQNNGGTASKAGTVTILDSGPFTIESSTNRQKQFQSIPAQESFLVKSKARISKTADEGENILRVRVQQKDDPNFIERELSITITGVSSALSVTKTQTTPEAILPGEEAKLQVTIRNVGETTLRNVDLTLDLTDISVAPKQGSNSKTIKELAGGREHTFTFDLVGYPDAIAKTYKVPVTLSYDDETGNSEEQEETIGVTIGTVPELLVYFDRVDPTQKNPEGEIIIRFVNKGLAEIKLLEMTILENEDVEITSESRVIYVGNIDEDDYESAELSVKVNNNEATLPIRVRYKDALNKQYEEEYSLPIVLRSNGESSGPSTTTMIIVLVIIIAIIWWLVRRNKRKKQKK